MDISTASGAYAPALLLVVDVSEAASRSLGGPRYEGDLRAPVVEALLDDAGAWVWADDREHLDLIVGKSLAATVDFACRRRALTVPVAGGRLPRELWPDLDERVASLHEALVFAASVADAAWRPVLGPVLEQWIRDRLAVLVAPPESAESLGALEARLRRAVVLTHRYRQVRHQLFGDGTWTGREQGLWWCPDVDLAARVPFDASGELPAHVVRLRTGTSRNGSGDVTRQTKPSGGPRTVGFVVTEGVVHLAGEPADGGVGGAPDDEPGADRRSVVVDLARIVREALDALARAQGPGADS
jgi:hypothetical protein